MSSLTTMTIAEAATHLAKRDISAAELTEAHLARISTVDGILHSFLLVMTERAMQRAAEADLAFQNGDHARPLLGIPLGLKDLFEVSNYPTTAGSKHLAGQHSVLDAAAVTRLESAGAILLGKLNMHEWAMGVIGDNTHYGACHNPWDVERICGGSSSGSGAAVAHAWLDPHSSGDVRNRGAEADLWARECARRVPVELVVRPRWSNGTHRQRCRDPAGSDSGLRCRRPIQR